MSGPSSPRRRKNALRLATLLLLLLAALALLWPRPPLSPEPAQVTPPLAAPPVQPPPPPVAAAVPSPPVAPSEPPAPAAHPNERFQTFLLQMNRHAEILHTEFNLLEQLSALRDPEEISTNHLVFEPLRLAFADLGRQAATNPTALQLLLDASHFPALQGVAIAGLGLAAAQGSDAALDLLLDPGSHGWLLSGATSRLVAPARAGNPRAIAFLVAVARDPTHEPLWNDAIDGLAPSAENGDESALAALIQMTSTRHTFLRQKILDTLQAAAARGNPTAARALPALRP